MNENFIYYIVYINNESLVNEGTLQVSGVQLWSFEGQHLRNNLADCRTDKTCLYELLLINDKMDTMDVFNDF